MAFFTVNFYEVSDSPRESMDEDGFKATMTFICAWSDRLTLAYELAGGATNINGTTFRVRPFDYPYAANPQTGLGTPPCVIGVEVEPLQGSKETINLAVSVGSSANVNPFGTYDLAMVTATFRVPPWKYLTNPESTTSETEYVSENLEPTAEFYTFPTQKLWWDEAHTIPLIQEEAPGLIVKMMEWTRTRHRVIQTHVDCVNLMGCVNKDPIVSDRFGFPFPAETLLYTSPRLEQIVMPDGVKCMDLVTKFMYREQGWNRFFRAGQTVQIPLEPTWTFEWKSLYDAAGHLLKPYPPADFKNLLWN